MRTTWQIHGAEILVANGKQPQSDPPPKADGIITDRQDVALVMRFADCVPLVLYDPRQSIIGLAHAGWRGTVAQVGPTTVRAMQENFGCLPSDIMAGIGPSICASHYAVGPEVVAAIKSTFGSTDGLVSTGEDEAAHLDLWAANKEALQRAGVGQVEVSGLCTAHNVDEFFSHRAEGGQTGRFGAVVKLAS